jgi:hypothetical protein
MAFVDGTGIGVVLGMEGGTPGTYAAVGRVKSISGPNLRVAVVEKTTLDDTYARKVAGRIDGGEVTFDIELDPIATEHAAVITAIKARALKNFQVTFPAPWTAAKWEFAGILSDFSPSVDDEGPTASVTIAVSGEPDYAAGP